MGVHGLKRIGLGITAIWVGVVIVYVWFGVEPAKRPWNLDPNNFGDFLAGTVGPVAFFWLMLAFFIQSAQLEAQGKSVSAQEATLKATQEAIELQRQSLDMQREELKLQRYELELQRKETARLADEAAKQARAISDNELHARRDVFFRQLELIEAELTRLLLLVFRRIDEKPVDHRYLYVGIPDLLQKYSLGEKDAIFNRLIEIYSSDSKLFVASIAKHMGNPNHLRRVYALLEDVFAEASVVDPTNRLTEFFEQSILGEIYLVLCDAFGWERKFLRV